jgi:hypothetical protein
MEQRATAASEKVTALTKDAGAGLASTDSQTENFAMVA